MPQWNELIQAARTAVEHSHQALVKADPEMATAGCGILTDDDLGTFYVVFCTEQEVREEGDEFLFSPVDWNLDSKPETGDEVHRLMSLLEETSGLGHEEYTKRAFGALVKAAAEVRVSGLLSAEAFLVVASTDPGVNQEAWEEEAIVRLNADATVRRYRQWHLALARQWLLNLRQKDEPLSYADQDRVLELEQKIAGLLQLLSIEP